MGWIDLPGFQGLFSSANPIGLLLFASTAALAHPRHHRLAIAFVVVGGLIRLGGLL